MFDEFEIRDDKIGIDEEIHAIQWSFSLEFLVIFSYFNRNMKIFSCAFQIAEWKTWFLMQNSTIFKEQKLFTYPKIHQAYKQQN